VILAGRKLLVTGVVNRHSIAWEVARQAQEAGAEVVLTGFGRARRMTERAAAQLPEPADVLELDVNDPGQLAAVRDELDSRWGRLDGVLHAIAFAPPDALGGAFLETPSDSAETAFRTSAFSLKALTAALLPLLERAEGGGAVVGLDFDGAVAWPVYDWMGVSKAAFESVARYLARDLGPQGIRVNLVSAGPYRSIAAKSIPGFEKFEEVWVERAPLGWDLKDAEPIAKACVALLSDWFPATTGEKVHVDGGFHAVGA
jgi:enoyl ACP reductase